MSDDARTIHTFWHGGKLPPLAHACIKSFVSHGHPIRVHAYDPLVLPAGAVLEDARDVVATDHLLYRSLAATSVQAFSDFFRYCVLHQRGGWWVDADVYCLTSDLPHEGRAWSEQEPGVINNAILRFPKGDPLCERLVTLARRRATPPFEWGAIGPALTTEVLSPHHDDIAFGSRETFYPLHHLEAHFLWLPEFKSEVVRRTQGAAFLHCWAATLTTMGVHAGRSAPAESFLADILRHSPGVKPLGSWQGFVTRRRIENFLRQPRVRKHRVAHAGSRPFVSLAGTPARNIPTPLEVGAVVRRRISRLVHSRWPGLPHAVRIVLRAARTGAQLPPGSLRPLQHKIDADQRFFLRQAEALGPIFKVILNGTYTTCVLGHGRGLRLIAANEDRLPGLTINLKRLFPIGALREMTGETHQQYRRLLIEAMQATPLSVHRDESEQIIREGLAVLAQTSPPPVADAIRDQLRQMTTRIMLRVLFGVHAGSAMFKELEANYRRFGPDAPVYNVKKVHACAFAKITTALRHIAHDMQRDGDHPACFLRYLVESEALDETLLGNLAYLFEPSHFDLYSLWHWVLALLGTHPEVPSTFIEKSDEKSRRQYAEAIVLETLRMEQSELLYRRVTSDIVFDGYLIPADTNLRVCLWEGHKDAEAFADPFIFNPSRFVGQTYGREKFAPFGLGQRHCVGANLVVGLSTIFIQVLLENYSLEATGPGSAYLGPYHWQPNSACAIRLTRRASREKA